MDSYYEWGSTVRAIVSEGGWWRFKSSLPFSWELSSTPGIPACPGIEDLRMHDKAFPEGLWKGEAVEAQEDFGQVGKREMGPLCFNRSTLILNLVYQWILNHLIQRAWVQEAGKPSQEEGYNQK